MFTIKQVKYTKDYTVPRQLYLAKEKVLSCSLMYLVAIVSEQTVKQKNIQEGQDGPVSHTYLPDKLWVNWLFGSREKVHYRFSRWWPSWISNQNDFSYFWSTYHLNIYNEVSSQLAFGSGEKVLNNFSTWMLGRPSCISDQNDFSYF